MDIVFLTIVIAFCGTSALIGCASNCSDPDCRPAYPLACNAIIIDRPHWNIKCFNKTEGLFPDANPDYYYTSSEWFDDRTKAALLPDAGAMLLCRIEKKRSNSRRFPFVKSKDMLSCVLEKEYTRHGNSNGIKCKWGVGCMTISNIRSLLSEGFL
jgi:hypothetical protein